MEFAHFKVNLPATQIGNARVEMDGKDITHTLRNIEIFAGTDKITTVKLELIASVEGSVDGSLVE